MNNILRFAVICLLCGIVAHGFPGKVSSSSKFQTNRIFITIAYSSSINLGDAPQGSNDRIKRVTLSGNSANDKSERRRFSSIAEENTNKLGVPRATSSAMNSPQTRSEQSKRDLDRILKACSALPKPKQTLQEVVQASRFSLMEVYSI